MIGCGRLSHLQSFSRLPVGCILKCPLAVFSTISLFPLTAKTDRLFTVVVVKYPPTSLMSVCTYRNSSPCSFRPLCPTNSSCLSQADASLVSFSSSTSNVNFTMCFAHCRCGCGVYLLGSGNKSRKIWMFSGSIFNARR